MTYTHGSLFAGIGGFDLAFEAAGFSTTWQVEYEPFCQQVLRRRFPRAQVYGDIYQIAGLPRVDVITAGFPCQPFSLAGSKRGMADDRAGVIFEMLRVIDEVKPHAVLLENSPNFAKIADGRPFAELLEWFAGRGYDAEWGRLRASDAGAPHRRERWFCVAYTNRRGHAPAQAQQHATSECGWTAELHAPVAGGPDVADASSSGRKEFFNAAIADHPGHTAGRFVSQSVGNTDSESVSWTHANEAQSHRFTGRPGDGSASSIVLSQPGVDRITDGISSRLDGHRWPAGQGAYQHAWEAPRILDRPSPYNRARTKALGNAVVPQVVYPVAIAIREFLEGL